MYVLFTQRKLLVACERTVVIRECSLHVALWRLYYTCSTVSAEICMPCHAIMYFIDNDITIVCVLYFLFAICILCFLSFRFIVYVLNKAGLCFVNNVRLDLTAKVNIKVGWRNLNLIKKKLINSSKNILYLLLKF